MKKVLMSLVFTLVWQHAHSQCELPSQICDGTHFSTSSVISSVDIPFAAETDIASDGAGHHFVMRTNDNRLAYYLINSLGTVLRSAILTSGENPRFPSIACYGGVVHIAFLNEGTSPQRLQLYKSTDAGANWSQDAFQSTTGTVGSIDSYADFRGVHVIYGGSAGVKYYLRRPQGVWAEYSADVTSQSAQFARPRIVTHKDDIAGTDSAHVLAGFQAAGDVRMFSFQFPASGNGTNWLARTAPGTGLASFVISPALYTPEKYIHLLTIFEVSSRNVYHNSARAYDGSPGWRGLQLMTNALSQSGPDGVLVYTSPYHFPTFVRAEGTNLVKYRQVLRGGSGTPDADEATLGYGYSPAMSRNLERLAVAWTEMSNGKLHFAWRPTGICEPITENYTLYGENWIISEVAVAAGKTLTLKAGSVTHVFGEYRWDADPGGPSNGGPGKLIISAGASLNIEPGAQLILENSPVPGFASGVLDLGNSVALTIPGGATVEAKTGSRFLFGTGTSGLTVQGSLSLPASGTVTFTRSGTTGTWAGITVTGSNTIRNAVISHAATGIKVSTGSGNLPVTISGVTSISNCGIGVNVSSGPTTLSSVSLSNCLTGVYTKAKYAVTVQECQFSGCAISINILSQSPQLPRTIEDCSFTNVGTSGVVVDNFSAVTLRGNSMTGPVEDMEAITLTAASPTILSSNIQLFKYAIYCGAGSSPDLAGGHSDPARNVLNNNGYGVTAVDYSSPLLGDSWLNTGMNSIFDNSQADVLLSSYCIVLAENNWWGKTEDPPGQFDVDATSFLYYDPWLQEDPNPSYAPLVKRSSPSTESLPMIRQALHQRTEGRYADFANTLRTIIQSEETSVDEKEWSVSQLLLVAQHLPSQRVSEYLEAIAGSQPSLTRVIRSVLPSVLFSEDRASEAVTRLDMNLRDYPPGPIHRQALYQKFLHLLHASEDISGAWDLLNTLVATYPRSREERLARAQIATYLAACGDRSLESYKEPAAGTSHPAGFSLSQNYPNPFNPTTNIRFDLPRDARVELSVFDVLGRRIAMLMSDTKTAGTHSVAFDASGLGSGVYFYRLSAEPIEGTASAFHAIKKLMLVR